MWLLIQTNKSNFMNKKILFILFSLFSIISYSQSYENLNKYKGFKEIWIGENINKYKSYIVKIDKKGDLYYGGMPITESDVYYYENSRIKTIFGLEIANIFLVTNYYGNITQINIIPKRPDNSKQILNFYESEFGKPSEVQTNDINQRLLYLWEGNEIVLKITYISINGNLYADICYLESYEKVQRDK